MWVVNEIGNTKMQKLHRLNFCLRVMIFTAIFACLPSSGWAMLQEGADEGERLGQFVTLTNPISDSQVASIGNIALDLQARAERQDRDAVLVLQIPPGLSRFGQVSDLARRLTAAELSRVRLVAWVPKSVKGYHSMLALICNDIVMHPDAALGDIGLGKTVPQAEQDFILQIVDRPRNNRLSRGMVMAMMNPNSELLRVRLEEAAGIQTTRFLTADELKIYRQRKTTISETETIKAVGAPGFFYATDAITSGFLVGELVEGRQEIAELYNLPVESMRESSVNDEPVKATRIAINEMITPLTEEFILRQIRQAKAAKSNMLIFEITSPGGYLHSSLNIANAIADIDPVKMTTVAWIPKEAISGAAVIAMGADRIVMAPESKIGDAGVIQETQEGGAFERVPEKQYSYFLVAMQNLAEKKNRPTALLQAMVDRNLKVYEATNKKTGKVTYMSQLEIEASAEEWIQGPVVPESREEVLLTLNGRRAFELGLAAQPAANFDELRIRLGVPESNALKPLARTWVDTLVWFLNTEVAGFGLITLAIFFIYIEAHIPTGFFGICSAVLFALFFWARYLGGTSGSLEAVLFVLGTVLLLLEMFVVPGFGVFGISGILLMASALVMASSTFDGLSTGEQFQQSMRSLGTLTGALVTVIVVATVMNRFLPAVPFLNRMILTPPSHADADPSALQLDPELMGSSAGTDGVAVGAMGVSESSLRPTGKATIDGHYVDVVSDGSYIDHGQAVEVVRVSGSRVVVRKVEEGTAAEPTDESTAT